MAWVRGCRTTCAPCRKRRRQVGRSALRWVLVCSSSSAWASCGATIWRAILPARPRRIRSSRRPWWCLRSSSRPLPRLWSESQRRQALPAIRQNLPRHRPMSIRASWLPARMSACAWLISWMSRPRRRALSPHRQTHKQVPRGPKNRQRGTRRPLVQMPPLRRCSKRPMRRPRDLCKCRSRRSRIDPRPSVARCTGKGANPHRSSSVRQRLGRRAIRPRASTGRPLRRSIRGAFPKRRKACARHSVWTHFRWRRGNCWSSCCWKRRIRTRRFRSCVKGLAASRRRLAGR